jgi:DnaK suppressor protein
MLTERRRALQNDVEGRVRDGRASRSTDVRDYVEHSDADVQGDIDLAVLQMRAETLTRIDRALARLDAGTYGRCVECKDPIPEPRLRALPFAHRCQACQRRREEAQGRARQVAQRTSGPLFPDPISP